VAELTGYTFSVSVAALSPNAGRVPDKTVSVDHRAASAKWFLGGSELYAVGSVYPEEEERLAEQLAESFENNCLRVGLKAR